MTTVAAVNEDQLPPASRREALVEQRTESLSRGQAVAVAMSVVVGLVVAGDGLAGSYVTVSGLAARRGVPLPGVVPVGIDGGLVAVVVLDLVLAWIGHSGGVVASVRACLVRGDCRGKRRWRVARSGRGRFAAAAPVMLLAMVEAGRTVLLRCMGKANNALRDPVPMAWWVLAPWRTWLLWRRMVLWRVTSYRQAVDTELKLHRAVTQLRSHYGRQWRRRAPTDLGWMLRTGTHVDEVCAR